MDVAAQSDKLVSSVINCDEGTPESKEDVAFSILEKNVASAYDFDDGVQEESTGDIMLPILANHSYNFETEVAVDRLDFLDIKTQTERFLVQIFHTKDVAFIWDVARSKGQKRNYFNVDLLARPGESCARLGTLSINTNLHEKHSIWVEKDGETREEEVEGEEAVYNGLKCVLLGVDPLVHAPCPDIPAEEEIDENDRIKYPLMVFLLTVAFFFPIIGNLCGLIILCGSTAGTRRREQCKSLLKYALASLGIQFFVGLPFIIASFS
jgi:hypothetical protein